MNGYACITGAAGGLGRAMAAECAHRGWDLVLTDVEEKKLGRLATGMERLFSVNVVTHSCDLTDPIGRRSFWRRVDELGVRFHHFINVAGLDVEGLLDERSEEELRRIIRLNIEATVEMTRESLRMRSPYQRFHVINVSSLAAFYSMPVKAVYAASKRFLLNFSLALHEELKSDGVSVLAVCPAGLPTTPDCIRRIEAQGWMGTVTTTDVGRLATKTINKASKNRRVYVPGVLNKVLRFASQLVPASVAASLVGRRMRQARKSQATSGLKAA